MIPYGTFTFFLIAFIVLIPVIVLGFLGKRSYIYNGISTAIMIVIIFASDKHNLLGQKYLSAQLFLFYYLCHMAGCPHYVLLSITTKEEYFYKICNNYGVVYSPSSNC